MADTGAELHDTVTRLWPLRRSLTGAGVRQTLAVLAERLPLEVTEVPTGTEVLDWTVPREWVVREAYVRGPDGRRVVDWTDSPLHLVGHSAPFRGRLSLEELRPHLHSLPDRPSLVPYRTSYYAEAWGFCVAHDVLTSLGEGEYDVVVDTELVAGALTYGEVVVPGRTEQEVLVSAHVCHPAQANDNLSGIAVAAAAARQLLAAPERPLRTHRFLFAPGTLGAIAWLDRHRADAVPRIHAGLVLTGLGDASPFSYKRSRRGDTVVDRAAAHLLGSMPGARVLDFSPYGYDERQFCSPGFDLPVGRLGRGVHGEYPQYHTSADDLSFVSPDQLRGSLELVLGLLDVLERDRRLVSTAPYGEPQLGRRGLYRSTGATPVDRAAQEMALLWLLSLCDGTPTLLDVAQRAELPFARLADAAVLLEDAGLLAEPDGSTSGRKTTMQTATAPQQT